MILAAALLSAQPAPSIYSDESVSNAVVEVFRDACTRGSISVSPDRGRVVTGGEVVDYLGVLPFARSTKKLIVIQFTNPRATYLVTADFAVNQPASIGRECVVVSRSISLKDAIRAIVWTAPDIEPVRTYVPGIHRDGWLVDARRSGFRASVSILHDRSIQLELGTYASAMKN